MALHQNAPQSVPIRAQLECVARELRMRRACYGRWVAEGRMKAADADREIVTMAAVEESLQLLHSLLIWAADHHPAPREAAVQGALLPDHEIWEEHRA